MSCVFVPSTVFGKIVDTLNKSVEFNSQPRGSDDGYTVSTQYCLLSKEESAASWDGWSFRLSPGVPVI